MEQVALEETMAIGKQRTGVLSLASRFAVRARARILSASKTAAKRSIAARATFLEGVRRLQTVTKGDYRDAPKTTLIGHMIRYFPDEWSNFVTRIHSLRAPPAVHPQASHIHIHVHMYMYMYSLRAPPAVHPQLACRVARPKGAPLDTPGGLILRKWASMRLQTLYRTLVGMMKHRTALRLLLRTQLPMLKGTELDAIVDAKYRLLATLQRYSAMRPDELADVETMFEEFPWLTIAYIAEVKDAASPFGVRFYSCLIDGTCADDGNGRRVPKYKVELPGHPILGNGKSDNQNHAVIFTRGQVLQAIDANQEGFLEESLKVCCALAEFDIKPLGAVSGPAIVGFSEQCAGSSRLLECMCMCMCIRMHTHMHMRIHGSLRSRPGTAAAFPASAQWVNLQRSPSLALAHSCSA